MTSIFLVQCDPEKIYQFFMKATQLDSCKNDYHLAKIEKEETETIIKEKDASLPTLKKEKEKWEKKYEWHKNISNKKADLKNKKVRAPKFQFLSETSYSSST